MNHVPEEGETLGGLLDRMYHKNAAQAKELKALREVEAAARIFVVDSYRPSPKYDAMRYDNLAAALHKYAPLPKDALDNGVIDGHNDDD